MPGLDVWHGGLSVVGFCVTILNTGKQKTNNNAIGGGILNTGKQKTNNNAIGGWILNIGEANERVTLQVTPQAKRLAAQAATPRIVPRSPQLGSPSAIHPCQRSKHSYREGLHGLRRVILGRNSIAGGNKLAGNTLRIRSCITKCFFPKTKQVIDHANALRNPKAYTITHELCCQERWGGHHHFLYRVGVLFYSARRGLSQGQTFSQGD